MNEGFYVPENYKMEGRSKVRDEPESLKKARRARDGVGPDAIRNISIKNVKKDKDDGFSGKIGTRFNTGLGDISVKTDLRHGGDTGVSADIANRFKLFGFTGSYDAGVKAKRGLKPDLNAKGRFDLGNNSNLELAVREGGAMNPKGGYGRERSGSVQYTKKF
jgi:hypothetical protein